MLVPFDFVQGEMRPSMFRTLVFVRVIAERATQVKEQFPLCQGDRLVGVAPSERGCVDVTFYIDTYALRQSQAEFLYRLYVELVDALPALQRSGYNGTAFQYWTSPQLPPARYVQALQYPKYRQRLLENLEPCG